MAVGDSSTFGGAGSSGAGPTALGLGSLSLGSNSMFGPSLPIETTEAEMMVPGLSSGAADLYGRGTALYGQGSEALGMAQRGELTAPQAAELKNYSTGLQNVSNQMFASMGRNVTQDTSAIGAQAFIDSQVNAMAQKEIQTTIQLGFGELSAAGTFTQESLGYSQAAANILMEAGKQQLEADKAYTEALTSAMTGIGKMFGMGFGGGGGGGGGGTAP
jgi:hypothetical protein